MSNETPQTQTVSAPAPGTPEYAASLMGAGSRTWNAVLGVPSTAQLIRGLARAEYSVEQIEAILTAAEAPVKASAIRYRVVEALATEEMLRANRSYGEAAIRRRGKDKPLPAEAIEFARAAVNGN